MIVYDLSCSAGHRFEGWFGSSDDFTAQEARGLVSCPHCGSVDVTKAPMAPAVPKKGNQIAQPTRQEAAQSVAGGAIPPQVTVAMEKLAALQAQVLKDSTWVGEDFARQSRAMHYGERE